MFLTVHTIAGAAIANFAPNIFLAFIGGFLSHFLLDMIPHGDEKLNIPKDKKEQIFRLIKFTALDLVIVFLLFATLLRPLLLAKPLIIITGVFASMLPDFLMAIHILMPSVFTRAYSKIHTFNHQAFGITIPFAYGFTIQLLFLALLLYPLLIKI